MLPNKAYWEHFEHGADLGIRGYGPSKAEAFAQAGLALSGAITDPQRIALHESVEIQCSAPDDELLLADWLNALIYEMAVRRMVFGACHVELKDHHLRAQVCGERTSVRRHRPHVEVKGATLTQICVKPCPGGWLAQTIIDV